MTLPVVQFDIHPPHSADVIATHIAHSTSLGLLEADEAPLKTLTIIANGPSSKGIDLKAIKGDTLAVNGALKLFTDQGLAPTYWAACDPQALVADFLTEPPLHTIYLVASKCHPLIFDMLRGRDVRLWHVNDHPIPLLNGEARRSVMCASSVTLCAMTLMRKLGYRHFETYGWDACFYGMAHHASDAELEAFPEGTIDLNVGGEMVDGEISGGRWYKTTTTWAAEAQDAVVQTHHADYDVTVYGEGLIRAILDSYRRTTTINLPPKESEDVVLQEPGA